jgi:hypothetical protein
MIPTRVIHDSALTELNAKKLIKHPEAIVFSSNSVFGGGLSNARQPNSQPLHSWENELRRRHTEDRAGHIHKTHRSGRYDSLWTDNLSSLLEPFRNDHKSLYNIMSRFDMMTYQMDLLESMHLKNFGNFEFEPSDESLEYSELAEGEISFEYIDKLKKAWEEYVLTNLTPDEEQDLSPLIVDTDVFGKPNRVENWTVAYDPLNKQYFSKNPDGTIGLINGDRAEAQWQKELVQVGRTLRVLPMMRVVDSKRRQK